MQVRVSTANVTDITLEVLDIDGVEADDGGEEADISLAQLVTKVEGTTRLGKIFFRTIKGLEQSLDILLVGFLSAEKVLAWVDGLLKRYTYVAKPDL